MGLCCFLGVFLNIFFNGENYCFCNAKCMKEKW